LQVKVVLFCGGLGARRTEHGQSIPKPMIQIGNDPILWHLMQYYHFHGHRDFVLCLGYKANIIKQWFLDYRAAIHSDFCISDHGSKVAVFGAEQEEWRATLVDTGLRRSVGERLAAIRPHVEGEEMFLANYGDGLSDLPLPDMIDFFRHSGKTACFVAVRPNFSYHLVDLDDRGRVHAFRTSSNFEIWINGGFFLFRPRIFDYIRPGEDLINEPFHRLMAEGELVTFPHRGFWASLDTLRDKQLLASMLEQGRTPWLPWTVHDRPA
jgi:glucose-1-phosphate cytidylyltransferase